MDLLHNLALGFATALSPGNIFYCFIGTLLGTLIGVLPGIGAPAAIAMLLPITFTMEPSSALIMLAGIFYGAQYGGSTTAILVNLPGESSSVVTAIDGYQMARQGRAGPALAVAAIGSFVAGTISTLLIALFALPLTMIALKFGPAEYFSLILLGLIVSVALAHGSVIKALGMIALGLLLGTIGTDIYTGTQRFSFGFLELADGIGMIPLAVGLFGIAEMLRNLENESTREVSVRKVSGFMLSREDIKASIGPVLRGTALGSVLGVLPGGGAMLSSFASYAVEKKVAKRPEEFGKGAIQAVAGPESANNAGAQTSFIPMLTLGIPSNPVMALMIGAMIIQGLVPGPNIAKDQPNLFWGLIASMWIGNFLLIILNLPLIGLWTRMLAIPYYMLFPAIVAFSMIGAYTVDNNTFDLYIITFFGLLGYLIYKLDCEPAPLLLGFVLGPMLEEHLRRAMVSSRGSLMIFIERPISAGLLLVTLAALVMLAVPAITSKRNEVFVEE
jgi:putative tricarboxylic transport membrane protein